MKMHRYLTDELNASGMPWRLDDGGKHFKIVLCDRLVGIHPKGGKSMKDTSDMRPILNLRSQIRRAISELKSV